MFNLSISKLDKVLLEEKMIDESDLKNARKYSKTNRVNLEESLLRNGILKKEDFYALLESRYGIEYIDLKSVYPEAETVSLIESRLLRSAKAFPFRREGEKLYTAMAEPLNIFHRDRLSASSDFDIVPFFSELDDIEMKQNEYFQRNMLGTDIYKLTENIFLDGNFTISENNFDDLINSIIIRAIDESASDIHFDPNRDRVAVRFRIDGILKKFIEIPNSIYPNLISKIKLMSRLDIAERRRPQDGSFEIEAEDSRMDIRSSFIPTLFGEKLVLRIVSKDISLLNIDKLGLGEEDERRIRRIIRQRQGLILVTGPTGSGKSTTLYSIINELNSKEKNIISIEEPVECRIDGVNQIQVNAEIGLSFSSILRHVLRQDPDIIVIGEIRDEETARIAVNASITGHLVISTVHTEDGPSTVSRLIDMGVEKHLVVSGLRAIISQRLYRENCSKCLRKKDADEELISDIFNLDGLFESKGCDSCSGRGYTKRKPVVEILELDSRIRDIFGETDSISEIRRALVAERFISLQDRMAALVEDGRMNAEDYFEYYSSMINPREAGEMGGGLGR